MDETRKMLLLALGSPETDDAQLALGCVLSALRAEAEMLEQGENLGEGAPMLALAHVSRMKALEEFFDAFVRASWSEASDGRKQGLRVVQPGGAP